MKMSTLLRGNPLASRHDKAAAQAERRKVLTTHTLAVLESKGYRFGRSLRLPGAFGFEAEHEGARVRVGIKNAADRWVAIPREGSGMIGEVDEVAVSAFDSWDHPSKVEVWLFQASDLLAKVEIAQAIRKSHGIQGLPFLPISGGGERRRQIVSATGTLDAIGRLIDVEAIEWIENGHVLPATSASITAAPAAFETVDEVDEAEADDEVPLTISEAKRRLAKTFGVSPEKVKIIVEA